jgi:hypothetical protein
VPRGSVFIEFAGANSIGFACVMRILALGSSVVNVVERVSDLVGFCRQIFLQEIVIFQKNHL